MLRRPHDPAVFVERQPLARRGIDVVVHIERQENAGIAFQLVLAFCVYDTSGDVLLVVSVEIRHPHEVEHAN